jgi:hypothetical protein
VGLMAAASILNKESRKADKGCSSRLRVRRRANNSSSWKKKIACYEMLHRALEAAFCEHGNEPSCSMKGGELLDWVTISFQRTLFHGASQSA